jgi:NAD(P)-dependent dehydrogenase (short-subunit alcohol dehydrogenase family)
LTTALLPTGRRSDRDDAPSNARVVSGATASLTGGLSSTAFASAKAAQLNLAESLAKQFGPEKIHVSYVVLDGVVDLEKTMANKHRLPKHFHYLATQPERAWTFLMDLRLSAEKW